MNESDMEMEVWEAAFPDMEVLSRGLHADRGQGNPRRGETIVPSPLCEEIVRVNDGISEESSQEQTSTPLFVG